MPQWRRICCPVDFSETAHVALHAAADLARRVGAEMTLLHVSEEPVGTAPEVIVSPPELFERIAAETERRLDGWRSEAEAIAGGPVRSVVVTGKAAAEIVRFAREGGFDLVVMGTHGRTAIRHLVLGSVTEKVVRQAECHVLVIRGPRSEK